MEEKVHKFLGTKTVMEILGVLILLGAVGYGVFYLYTNLKTTQGELASRNFAYSKLQATSKELEDRLAEVRAENEAITATLSDQQKANVELEREKIRKEREIDELTKLTTLDPELLKKYSKVFFLSENYVPPELENIDSKYVSNPTKTVQILEDVMPYFIDMMEDAERDDVVIQVSSGYRSFSQQKNLKDSYTVTYGAGTANNFSAEQGYSEHQLGTTLDLTTPALKGALPGFDATTAYKWLTDNAYKHGFILSYPKGNAFYKYEPWHWRFVGEDLARDLHRAKKYFYEWDQRDIDEYLINIFD